MKRVLVTGATGFTGSYVLPMLLEQGFRLRCLLRPASEKKKYLAGQVEWVYGDLDNLSSLIEAMKDVEILVNLASIGFGHAPNIVHAALISGVKRALFISTTAIFTTLNAPSKAIRLSAEDMIKSSGLQYTILRPTMIYGSSQDRNMSRLIRYLSKSPVIPVFGEGKYLQQPVYVGDVAKAVVDCISTEKTFRRCYNIPGAQAITYNEIIETICQLLRHSVVKIHLPARPFISFFHLFEKFGLRFPIRREQILRLNEHKVFDFDEASKDFYYSPCSFEQGVSLELKEMGLIPLWTI
jgi:nucleoside-diphosphate-sugar epimerase